MNESNYEMDAVPLCVRYRHNCVGRYSKHDEMHADRQRSEDVLLRATEERKTVLQLAKKEVDKYCCTGM